MDPVDIKNPQTNELKEKILHIVKDISPDYQSMILEWYMVKLILI